MAAPIIGIDPEACYREYPLFWVNAALMAKNAERRAQRGDSATLGSQWLESLDEEFT